MVVRIIDMVLCWGTLFCILFGIVSGNIGANGNIILKTRKKYVIPSEGKMNEQIFAEGMALKSQVDREYEIVNRGGIKLHGYLICAEGGSDRYIFCSHSYHSRLAGFEFGETAPIWLKRGYNVFLVDHRAHGSSGGKFISFGQYESEDCLEWLEFMRKEFGEHIRIALVGQSMGAATVLMMSGKKQLPPNVRCIISDSAYICFYTELWHLLPLPKWSRSVILWPMDRYLDLFHHIRMKDSDALDAVKRARVPILFIHGAKDNFVPLWMNKQLYEACSSEKARIVFPDATHIKSHAYDPVQYEQVVTWFADKYMS